MSMEIKDLGRRDYLETYNAMREFSAQRMATTTDQIWLLEHVAVYTLGLSGNRKYLLNTNRIPVVETDRGGQVTYHGPGQLIVYLLLDINRRPYGIKKMIALMEQSIIDYLQDYGIMAERKTGAPGVYIQGEKVAALGVRVRQGRTYHGLAINVDMDLEPFKGINPCGYADMRCTQLSKFVKNISISEVKKRLSDHLLGLLDVSAKPVASVA